MLEFDAPLCKVLLERLKEPSPFSSFWNMVGRCGRFFYIISQVGTRLMISWSELPVTSVDFSD